jgi:hypothetical protein
MSQVGLARVAGFVPRIPEIAFGHHPKCPDGPKRPAIVAVEFVPVIAIDHDLPFESARQLQIVEEGIARVVVPFASVAIPIANMFSAIARVVLDSVRARTAAQFDPRHLDVADVVVSVTRIEIEHRFSITQTISSIVTDGTIMGSCRTDHNSRSDRVEGFWSATVLGERPSRTRGWTSS